MIVFLFLSGRQFYMKHQSLVSGKNEFSGENGKIHFKMSSAEILPSILSVKEVSLITIMMK